MTIIFYFVLFLEFLFHGYCVYIYCSAIFKDKEKIHTLKSLLIFLSASIAEFCIYVLFKNTPINMAVTIILTTIVCIISFNVKAILPFFHSIILTGLLAMTELLSIPIINLAVSENYLNNHSINSEIIVSTVSKLIFFIICKVISMISEKESDIKKSIWLFSVPLLSLIDGFAVTSLSDLCGIDNRFNIVIIIFSLTMLSINLVVFAVHESYIKTANENEKIKLLEQRKNLDYEHYKILLNNYDNSRIMIHDFKHHISVINSLAQNENKEALIKYLESFNQSENTSNDFTFTGNKIVDIVISQKFKYCTENGIQFIFNPNNIMFDFVDESDMCCIISNILDNAIEAAEKSSEKIVRLDFYSNEENSVYLVETENSCNLEPIRKNGKLISSKNNKQNHGIGLLSIERAIKKYKGEIEYNYSNETKIFKTTIMMHRQ